MIPDCALEQYRNARYCLYNFTERPKFEDVAAMPPMCTYRGHGTAPPLLTHLGGPWFARWHDDGTGRPALRCIFEVEP